jgi:AmmeMemoRadiSam system protein A
MRHGLRFFWIGAVLLGVVLLLGGIDVSLGSAGRIASAPALSAQARSALLILARRQLVSITSGEGSLSVDPQTLSPELRRNAACFVTLEENGVLRGCMLDSFTAHEPLYKNVLRNLILAAQDDPRFPPVARDEVPTIRIELSVLGTPTPLSFEDPQDLIDRLTPGKDGVILKTRWGLSTYLPQVWETFPDPASFLSHLCEKQGVPADTWKVDPSIRVEVYRVTHFAEAQQA